MKPGTMQILSGGVAILLVVLACSVNVNLTEPPPLAPEIIVSQTLAALTQLAASNATPVAGVPDANATPTFTLEQPVPNSTFTATLQPIVITADALCYVGPGEPYEVVSAIQKGTDVKLIGKGDVPGWWILENPIYKDPCWISANYVQLDPGFNTSGLTTYSAPPTPTPVPNFSVSYDYLDSCVGWDPAFKVTNTGGFIFKSYSAEVEDTNTSTTVQSSSNEFNKTNGCVVSQSIPTLESGKTGWAHAYSFLYDPTGHTMNATITLCSEINLGGTCVSQSLQFTP